MADGTADTICDDDDGANDMYDGADEDVGVDDAYADEDVGEDDTYADGDGADNADGATEGESDVDPGADSDGEYDVDDWDCDAVGADDVYCDGGE